MRGLWADVSIGGVSQLICCDDRQLMQVPPELLKCVCFLTGRRRGKKVSLSTGFFASVPIGFGDHQARYLVTARHCVSPIGADGQHREPFDSMSVRVNEYSGGSREIPLDQAKWRIHPTADAAIYPIEEFSEHDFELEHWPLRNGIATREWMAQEGFGPGEEVLMSGQLVYHPGATRMLPIVRTGTIASLPDEPVRLSTGSDVATLVEVRSIGGLSGSPAFLHFPEIRRDPQGWRRELPDRIPPRASGGPNCLLGLVHGFTWTDANDPDRIGEGKALNSGITAIVPVERIIELVDAPDLVAQREAGRVRSELQASSPPIL